ncbi:MAG: hypothetical protein CR996_00320 [Draconibacterium sp.]|nr:MAG: hypothetical protein CR996_00320 [Draconibacterium sp.]PIF06473.1 MAG: hypothetical protein CSA36_01495 [Draconibacterium sp.]
MLMEVFWPTLVTLKEKTMCSKILKNWILLAAGLVLFSCEKENSIQVSNPLNKERPDEVLILSRDELAGKVKLPEEMLPVFMSADNELLPSQLDDIDGNGIWDEAAILLDMEPNETKKIKLGFVEKSGYPEFQKRTNLRLGILQDDGTYKEVDSYNALSCVGGFKVIAQAESVSWENDKIGFRVYFDCRNVKDLFGKLKPEMIVDKIGTKESPSYHKLEDWGMDVLHCGSSLGSGGLALMLKDSLYRLGSTEKYEYQKIVEGPVRSVFELRYAGWDVDGKNLEAVERISIYPGKYWFQSDVTVTGCPQGSQVVTGIVTSQLTREPFQFKEHDFQCVGTHDIQSLNNDELGMAVIVPLKEAGKIDRTSDLNFFQLGYKTVPEKSFSNIISETFYIGQHCDSGKPARHYFFSVWGLENERWKTEEGFKSYIENEAINLSNPLLID